ncbi:MAG: M23 family metallopeptidase [Patescibacteria group bacterium]
MIGRFLFSAVLVPGFHVILMIRRQLDRLYLPAKNKILFLFSNRFAIHVVIVTISIFSVFTNVRPTEVRAEEYGQESVLYALLGEDGQDIIEEVAGDTSPLPEPTSYRGAVAFSSPVARDPVIDSLTSDSSTTGALTARPTNEATTSTQRDVVQSYTVESGDTVSTIAQKFGLSITTILWANDLSVRSTIRPGDELVILPVDGVVHKVARGDTLSKISKLYGTDAEEIQTYNKLANANDLSIGEALLIPGGERQAPAAAPRVASVKNLFTPGQTAAAPSVSGGTNAGGFIWPTDLRKINTYYGQYYAYGRHWGLDIDCNYNNNNYAAADGIVTRAGWNSGGYGYLVEIDQGNGIVTRYGHNARVYVKAGQTVAQGDRVGLCGTTGRSSGTHLHFEVRVNGNTVNPLDYL